MTSENTMWEELKTEYLNKVRKELSSVRHPRREEVLADVSSHLDRRFTELESNEQNWENFQTVITEMGPPRDYAELLEPEAAGKKVVLPRSLLWIALCLAGVIAGVILWRTGEFYKAKPVTPKRFRENFGKNIERFKIDTATLKDVIKAFGEPVGYIWGDKNFEKKNLPGRFVIVYPAGFHVFMSSGEVVEIRYEGAGTGYTFLGEIKVGSTLEHVLEVVGQPREIVEGEEIGWDDGVLYKDVEGRKGYCYYLRADKDVRFFFLNYKVKAMYITRSDYGGH